MCPRRRARQVELAEEDGAPAKKGGPRKFNVTIKEVATMDLASMTNFLR